MTAKYVVVDDGRLVIERWVGMITHAEFVSHVKQKLQDESIAFGAKVLADVRAAEFPETTLDLIHEIADLYDKADNKTSITTYAAVFSGTDFDMAKSWEAQSRQHGVNTIVFNNLEVACIWLGIDLKEAQALLDSIDI